MISNNTINGLKITVKEGDIEKGLYSSGVSLARVLDWCSAGQTVYLSSGSFNGSVNMKSGVNVIGSSPYSTYIGTLNFPSGVSNCELQNAYVYHLNFFGGNWTTKARNIRTNYRISITGGAPWLEDVEFYQGDYNYGIDVNNAVPSLVNVSSTTYRNDPNDLAAIYLHNYATPTIDVESIQNKNQGILIGDYSYATVYANFCNNTWDLYAEPYAYDSDIEGVFSAADPADCLYPPDDYESYFNIGCWDYCSSRSAMDFNQNNFENRLDLADSDLQKGLYLLRSIRQRMINRSKSGKQVNPMEFTDDYSQAIDLLKQYIEKRSFDHSSLFALRLLQSCYGDRNQLSVFQGYLNKWLLNSKVNKFKPHLLNLFLSSYLQQGEIEKALNVADQIIALQPETDLLV